MINVISCDIYLSSTINVFPYYMKFINYFRSKPTHALLASKRCPISLQKVPFKTLTNALLKSN